MHLVTPWLFIRGHHQDKEWNVSPRADLNPVFLHAEVVGAAGHVGQRTDEVVAAKKRWIQQHCTHLLHLLQPQNTQRVCHSSFKSRQFVSVQFFVVVVVVVFAVLCRRMSLCSKQAYSFYQTTYQQDMSVDCSAGWREVRRHHGTSGLVWFCFHPAIPKHFYVMSQHTWERERDKLCWNEVRGSQLFCMLWISNWASPLTIFQGIIYVFSLMQSRQPCEC